MKLKDALASYLKKIGMEDGKVAALFNADGSEFATDFEGQLTTHDAERIKTIKTTATTEGFNQGHQKGLSEGAEKWETDARKKYEVDKEKKKKGLDLVDEIITVKASVKPELEEDKVKIHPAFIRMENDLKEKLTNSETTWKAKHEKYQSEVLEKETLGEIFSTAKTIVDGLKPVLPKDAAKAAKQKQFLEQELKGFKYQKVDGKFIVLKPDGKPHEDAHGNKISFEDLVKNAAGSIWDFESGENRQGAGNNNDGGGAGGAGAAGGKKIQVKTPANEQEYITSIKTAKTPEERMAIDDAWTASKAGATV